MKFIIKNQVIFFLIVFTVFVFIFSSCGKSYSDKKMQGVWRHINIYDIDDPNKDETWEFSNGNLYITTVYHLGGGVDNIVTDTAEYIMASGRKVDLVGMPPYLDPYTGTWEITTFKKDRMMWVLDIGGLLFMDFAK